MNKIQTVIANTYGQQVKTKSFIILLFLPILFILFTVGMGFISYHAASSDTSDKIAVIAQPKQLGQSFIKENKDEVNQKITSTKLAARKVKNGDLAGYVTIKAVANKISVAYHGNDAMDAGLKSALMKSITLEQSQLNLNKAHLSIEQRTALQRQPQFKTFINHHNATADKKSINLLTLNGMIFVMYFLLLIYSGLVATDIANDKGSKIIEVIFSSINATSYFIGKIIAMLLVMATQMVFYFVLGALSYYLLGHLTFTKELFNQFKPVIDLGLTNVLNVNLLFILLGLVIAIVLSAVCGALVSQVQDAAKAAQPIIIIAIAAFALSMSFQNNANSIVVHILSYVPLVSSFFMPISIVNGVAASWEVIISLLLNVASLLLIYLWVKKYYKGLMLQNDNGNLWQKLKSGMKYQ